MLKVLADTRLAVTEKVKITVVLAIFSAFCDFTFDLEQMASNGKCAWPVAVTNGLLVVKEIGWKFAAIYLASNWLKELNRKK